MDRENRRVTPMDEILRMFEAMGLGSEEDREKYLFEQFMPNEQAKPEYEVTIWTAGDTLEKEGSDAKLERCS